MFCSKCGTAINSYSDKCEACGYEFNKDELDLIKEVFPMVSTVSQDEKIDNVNDSMKIEELNQEDVTMIDEEIIHQEDEDIVISEDLEFYLSRIRELEGRVSLYKQKLLSLQEDMSKQEETKSRLENLESQIKSIEVQNQELTDKVTSLELLLEEKEKYTDKIKQDILNIITDKNENMI